MPDTIEKMKEFGDKVADESSNYVLTASAIDYVDSAGASLKDYELRGVSGIGHTHHDQVMHIKGLTGYVRLAAWTIANTLAHDNLIERAREMGAEKVVDVIVVNSNTDYDVVVYVKGTALIPKAKAISNENTK